MLLILVFLNHPLAILIYFGRLHLGSGRKTGLSVLEPSQLHLIGYNQGFQMSSRRLSSMNSPLQQKFALKLKECTLKMKELLNRFREIVNKMKAVEMLAVSLEQLCNSVNLHNQIGSSRQLTAMERHASVDSILKAVKQNNCDFDWFSMVTALSELDAFILQFEEFELDVENALEKVE